MSENKHQELEKAFREGKTIQSNNSGKWVDFVRQNQLDSPNWEYQSIDNWRVKPEDESSPSDNKQETLEEAALKMAHMLGKKDTFEIIKDVFIYGAKWQAEQDKKLYSEEEVLEIINSFEKLCYNYQSNRDWFPSLKSEWFEQFKKK
jgi:hypothetical protein